MFKKAITEFLILSFIMAVVVTAPFWGKAVADRLAADTEPVQSLCGTGEARKYC